MKVYASSRTDVGKLRELNEDNYFSSEQDRFFLVADGMGGHAAGEVASDIATRIISTFFLDHRNGSGTYEDMLSDAIREANRMIFEEASSSEERKGMGTTVVTSVLHEQEVIIAHVGDSRAYMVRDGSIDCLTEDHSWVNIQVRMGNISREAAQYHPLKNIITKALGIQEDVEVDVMRMAVRDKDMFILCSDGLNGMVDDEKLLEIAKDDDSYPTLDEKCEGMIEEALENGGEDNVTVVVFQVELEEHEKLDDTQPIHYDQLQNGDDPEELEDTQILSAPQAGVEDPQVEVDTEILDAPKFDEDGNPVDEGSEAEPQPTANDDADDKS